MKSIFNFIWVIACLLFVPCLFYTSALDYLNLPRELFWLGSGSIIIGYQIIFNKQIPILKDNINKSICLFLLWALVSICWAWQPYLSWPRWSLLFSAFFTFLVVRSFSEKQQQCLLWILAIQGFLGSILGFLQYCEISPFNQILQTDKPGLVMGHRNVASEYLLITLGASIALIKKNHHFSLNFSLCINACLILSTILITKCRGVIGALIIVDGIACYYIVKHTKSLKNRFFIFLGILIIHLLLFFIAVKVQPDLLNSFSNAKMGSLNMRIAHYSNTLMMAKENLPTGVGIGNFAINYTSHINSWIPDKPYSDKLILRNVHSDPLECLAELGPIGLILLMIVLYYTIFKYKVEDWQSRVIKFTIIAQLINACVNFPFQVIQTQLAMAIMFGILHINSNKINEQKVFKATHSISVKLITIFLILFFFQFQYKRLNAHIHGRTGLDYLTAREHKLALPHLRKAVAYTPRNVDIEMLLAYCLREMGYTTESSSIAENVLGVFPGYLPALSLIGLNALDINDLNRAVRAFETSYKLQPHQKATLIKLSYSYTKFAQELRYRNFILQAYETESKLLRLNPEATEIQLRMIVDLATLKEHVKAKELFDKLPQSYHDPRKYYVHAKMLLSNNNIFKAIEKLDEGLKLFPDEKVLMQFRDAILKHQINSTKNPQP